MLFNSGRCRVIKGIFVVISALFLGVSAMILPAKAADKCANAQTQAAMDECAGLAFKKSDAELNKLYKEITQRLLNNDEDVLKLLVKAQRAWISYRDAECKFSSSQSAEGSIYPVIYAQCLKSLTDVRIEEFTTYLNCEEGDMACPVPRAE